MLGGGSLLLIADHAPFGRLAKEVAARFVVEMRNCYTLDEAHAATTEQASHTSYTRENGFIGMHPITRGRDDSERIDAVVTYTGQSLSVPEGATAILELGDDAIDRMYALQGGQPVVTETISAAGRAQLVALEFGEGRVIVGAEAAMFTAQVIPRGDGQEPFRVGFNRSGTDDRQLALNVMRWLTRAL